jgi:hypothetical protein
VYRARDTRLGRDVAARVLPASFSTRADRLRRFEGKRAPLPASGLRSPAINAWHISARSTGKRCSGRTRTAVVPGSWETL